MSEAEAQGEGGGGGPSKEAEARGSERTLGLTAATFVGIGAIVGGGIFVLAGVAFATAGPAALVAFALNGVVAALTAMSFAEIASAFPANGGAYTFAKRILSVRAAFAVGWVLWFAYIVAGVLYALGFASFAALLLQDGLTAIGVDAPEWLQGRRFALLLASAATIWYAANFIRSAAGGGQWESVGKVVVFAILILVGLVALVGQSPSTTIDNVTPFFAGGGSGVLMAMGFTFITLQGFDLISAVGGEVKEPQRTIPRAMFLSLGCGLLIYLPLLFLVSAVGVEPGQSIGELARAQPEKVVPLAAARFMGPIGYWLVIAAAILSTLSALSANLLAASRVALTMAQDHTLPDVLGHVHPVRRTPVMAIYATALTLVAIVFMIPDLAAAGAAASLIFLVSFALVHLTTFLARRRGGGAEGGYRTRWFPAIPVAGGVFCAGLAVFQAVAVPDAGGVLVIWLGLGLILYWSLFARGAEIGDAAREGFDPTLVSMRGHQPLVLVPIANPDQAPAMIGVANALASKRRGTVLLLSIVPIADDAEPGVPPQLESTQRAVGDALRLSYESGYSPEALITAAADPMNEIGRIARDHHCGALLLGLGDISDAGEAAMERLLNQVDADVALLRAAPGWRLATARRVLVPVGGRGDQHELRARLLGSISRTATREVTFVMILPTATTDRELERARKEIQELAELKVRGAEVQILRAASAADALISQAEHFDLMILGLKSVGWRHKVFGDFALRMAREAPCATLFLSRRRHRALELLDPLRDDVVDSLKGAVMHGPIRVVRR